MIVVDASAVLELLIGGERRLQVDAEMLAHRGEWAAPDLVTLEVCSSLRREERAGRISTPFADDALSSYWDLGIVVHTTTRLWSRVWSLRHNFSAYDAAYVSLAEHLEVPLLTVDGKLARAAASLVEVVDVGPAA